MAFGLGVRAPRLLFLHDTPVTPFVAGLRDPLLVAPAEICELLDDEEWEAVVTHELMHLRHRDTWRNFGLELLRALLFFHVPLRLLIRRYRQEVEKVRDQAACQWLGSRSALAAGLVKVTSGIVRPSVMPSGCAAYSTLLLPRPQQTVERVRALARVGGRLQRFVLCLQILALLVFVPWQLSSERNAVRVGYFAGAGGPEHHSTVSVSAQLTSNPLSAWCIRLLRSP